MNDKLDALLGQMQQLEKELLRELGRKETEFFYKVERKRGVRQSFLTEENPVRL